MTRISRVVQEEIYLKSVTDDLRNHGYTQLADILAEEVKKTMTAKKVMALMEENKESDS